MHAVRQALARERYAELIAKENRTGKPGRSFPTNSDTEEFM